ncbi:NADPH-dependent FMN reductase [uncultured Winogradskyella sp.]|uniref:NADPH-dependent FMN reductase n=1 Tax=uncultured Winogradskyella sp. TaxID=395353 RepID=UPI00262DE1B3|nr:NAD(P)H-dependent oxidoreductase [uncultured Winogradskyella sp.]
MKKIVAFAGSNSKASINKQLAVYASSLVHGAEIEELDLNDYLMPMYGIDEENENGIPDKANTFSNHLKNSDGIILSLAEHNGSYAVAFKNVMDWVSRLEGKLWQEKPMLIMATSPGGRGGISVLQTATSTFPHMGANVVGKFSLPSFGTNFSNGKITDVALNSELLEQVKQLKDSL